MSNIITPAEFKTLRKINKKIDEDKVNEAIALAQDSDLNDILGGFFFDVVKNQAEGSYSDLMNGSEFTYCDEIFIHKGIKALLADYTYSRYIVGANINLTSFGATKKSSEDSEAISATTTRDVSKQSQIDAGIKFKTIRKYILSEPTLFSRYCSGEQADTGFNSMRIIKI